MTVYICALHWQPVISDELVFVQHYLRMVHNIRGEAECFMCLRVCAWYIYLAEWLLLRKGRLHCSVCLCVSVSVLSSVPVCECECECAVKCACV
jgi:hypothetical protein